MIKATEQCAYIRYQTHVYDISGVVLQLFDEIVTNINYYYFFNILVYLRCLIISYIQDLFTAASAQLYKSTKYHLYFKDITIVIPKSWPNNFTTDFISGPQVETAHVLVEKPNPLVDNKPYVSGMTGCGQPGKHIHLEPITVQVLPAVGLAGTF